jgi:Ca2+/Na+ antiporter
MIKALKVLLIVFGAIGIIAGLSYIFVPDKVAELYDFGEIADSIRWIMAFGGAIFTAAGVWVIIAAQDPIRHINWVKFEITKSSLVVVVTAYSIIQGDVEFSQVGPILILFAVFAVLFLVCYPWPSRRSKQ